MLRAVRKIEAWWRRPWPQGRCMWVGPDEHEIASLAGCPGAWALMGFRDKRPWRGSYTIGTDFDIAEDGSFHLFACRVRFRSKNAAGRNPVALNDDEMEYMTALYGDGNKPKAFSVRIESIAAAARRFAEDTEGVSDEG